MTKDKTLDVSLFLKHRYPSPSAVLLAHKKFACKYIAYRLYCYLIFVMVSPLFLISVISAILDTIMEYISDKSSNLAKNIVFVLCSSKFKDSLQSEINTLMLHEYNQMVLKNNS